MTSIKSRAFQTEGDEVNPLGHHPYIISTYALMSIFCLRASSNVKGNDKSWKRRFKDGTRLPGENCVTTPAGWTIAFAMSGTISGETGSENRAVHPWQELRDFLSSSRADLWFPRLMCLDFSSLSLGKLGEQVIHPFSRTPEEELEVWVFPQYLPQLFDRTFGSEICRVLVLGQESP
jgi:hypothetical protein